MYKVVVTTECHICKAQASEEAENATSSCLLLRPLLGLGGIDGFYKMLHVQNKNTNNYMNI